MPARTNFISRLGTKLKLNYRDHPLRYPKKVSHPEKSKNSPFSPTKNLTLSNLPAVSDQSNDLSLNSSVPTSSTADSDLNNDPYSYNRRHIVLKAQSNLAVRTTLPKFTTFTIETYKRAPFICCKFLGEINLLLPLYLPFSF